MFTDAVLMLELTLKSTRVPSNKDLGDTSDENLMIIHAVDYFLNIGDERRRNCASDR
jgi:hypothetical protein